MSRSTLLSTYETREALGGQPREIKSTHAKSQGPQSMERGRLQQVPTGGGL